MKKLSILISLLLTLFSNPLSAVTTEERDALVDLHISTDGANWTNDASWGFDDPCSWYGVTCDANFNVSSLDLRQNNLNGTIPSSIGNLTQLTFLALATNQLNGTIPVSVGNLTQLTHLLLSENELTGTIPDSIGNLTLLTGLALYTNQLSGSIPDSLGNLTKIEFLGVSDNQLSGTIPDSIGSLTLLIELYFQTNQLTGTIPSSIGNLTQLTKLNLAHNQLSGTIPESIGSLTQLTYLSFWDNQFTGTIPSFTGSLTNLTFLSYGANQFTGTIPESIGNLTQLTSLYFRENQLTGAIPDSIGSLTELTLLRMNDNNLTGTIPSSVGNLTSLTDNAGLYLSNNSLDVSNLSTSFDTFLTLKHEDKNWKSTQAVVTDTEVTPEDSDTNHAQDLANKSFTMGWYGLTTTSGVQVLVRENEELALWYYKDKWIPLHNSKGLDGKTAGKLFESLSILSDYETLELGNAYIRIFSDHSVIDEIRNSTQSLTYSYFKTDSNKHYRIASNGDSYNVWYYDGGDSWLLLEETFSFITKTSTGVSFGAIQNAESTPEPIVEPTAAPVNDDSQV